MPTSKSERCLAGVQTALKALEGQVTGLTVARNEDTAQAALPFLNQVDGEDTAIEIGNGVELRQISVQLEGYIGATTPGGTGPAAQDLAALAWQAVRGAENMVADIFQVLNGGFESTPGDEEGTAPHLFFVLTAEVQYLADPDNPFS